MLLSPLYYCHYMYVTSPRSLWRHDSNNDITLLVRDVTTFTMTSPLSLWHHTALTTTSRSSPNDVTLLASVRFQYFLAWLALDDAAPVKFTAAAFVNVTAVGLIAPPTAHQITSIQARRTALAAPASRAQLACNRVALTKVTWRLDVDEVFSRRLVEVTATQRILSTNSRLSILRLSTAFFWRGNRMAENQHLAYRSHAIPRHTIAFLKLF